MKKNSIVGLAGLIVVLLTLQGCSSSKDFEMLPRQAMAGSPAPSRSWDPEYYVYKNGKFRFIPGSYQPVLSRKNHFKRSLKGYMTKAG